MALLALAAPMLFGCRDDEITRYEVPKAEKQAEPENTGKHRTIAAMIPDGERTWFFKLDGKEAAVEAHKQEFEQFLRSVHFADKADVQPLTWTVPDDWRKEPASGLRYALFHLGPKGKAPELKISSFAGQAGGVLENVNRWREQLSLKRIAENELASATREIKVDGRTATLVDITGALNASSSAPARSRAPKTFSYTVPEGWSEDPDPQSMSLASFKVKEGDAAGEVTVSAFPGPAGGLLANVNRWREQVGLGKIGEDQLTREAIAIEVDGKKSTYVDLAGSGQKRILGVVVPREDKTWFFKFMGPTDLLSKHKPAFEAFVKSVHFEATGAKR